MFVFADYILTPVFSGANEVLIYFDGESRFSGGDQPRPYPPP
jgi:hypothetical protein